MRWRAPWFVISVALISLTSMPVGALQQQHPQPLVQSVLSIGMTVSDLDRSVEFYTKVLDFEKLGEEEQFGDVYERSVGLFAARSRTAKLKLGDEVIELTEFLTPRGRAIPADSASNDYWFQHIAIIVSNMDTAYQKLKKHKVRHLSPSPQRLPDWNKNAGGIEAFYFAGPDGHPLEILHFPPDKGDAKWHRTTNKLFLGIDHTAIVVSDTDQSLKLYRDQLGMRVAGISENYGPEQERLNAVFGARLRITTLKADHGPGIEFLEYLSPRTGRSAPVDTKANDLWHWQVRLSVKSPDKPALLPLDRQLRFSPLNKQANTETVLSLDRDGHALLFKSSTR